jgi:hypothetical protein
VSLLAARAKKTQVAVLKVECIYKNSIFEIKHDVDIPVVVIPSHAQSLGPVSSDSTNSCTKKVAATQTTEIATNRPLICRGSSRFSTLKFSGNIYNEPTNRLERNMQAITAVSGESAKCILDCFGLRLEIDRQIQKLEN